MKQHGDSKGKYCSAVGEKIEHKNQTSHNANVNIIPKSNGEKN
jgi:hypothetical protein